MECTFQQFESSYWRDMGSSDAFMLQRGQFLVKREPTIGSPPSLIRKVNVWLHCDSPLWQNPADNDVNEMHAHRVTHTEVVVQKINYSILLRMFRNGISSWQITVVHLSYTYWCSMSARCAPLMLSVLALPASGLGSRLHRHTPILVHEVSAEWHFVAYYVKKNCNLIGKQRKLSSVRSCSQLGSKLDGDDAPVLGPWWFFYMSALHGVIATVEKILGLCFERRPPPDDILQRRLDRSPQRRRFSGFVRHLLFFSERSLWTTSRRSAFYTQWGTQEARQFMNEGKSGSRSPVRSIRHCQWPDRRMFTKSYSVVYVVTESEWVCKSIVCFITGDCRCRK